MKLIAVDLDGTLLNNDGEISQTNITALQEFNRQGGIVTLATGRNSIAAQTFFKILNIKGYLISSNGSFITQIDQGKISQTLFQQFIEQHIFTRTFQLAQDEHIDLIASRKTQDDFFNFSQQKDREQNLYGQTFQLFNQENRTFASPTENTYLKMVLTHEDATKLTRVQQKLQEHEIDTTFSDKHYLEINPINITKGASLAYLCDSLNIPAKEVATFGDQENDISMLKYSGLSVAMGNATEKVKAISDEITKTNNESGVGYMLNKRIIKKQ